MPWIIFLLVFCGGVTAYEGRWCSRDDAAKVLAAWDQAMGIGGNGDTKKIIQKTSQFFLRLASDNPSVKPLFAKVNIDNPKSPEFQAHALRIATGLDLCVNALQNSRTLEAITSHLAMQHEARPGVTVEYFNAVRKYIDHNLPQLVDNLDLEAWDNCMTPIFNAITAQLP